MQNKNTNKETNKKALYINYIMHKYNTEIKQEDYIDNNFEYKNIIELWRDYQYEEPVALLDFINKYHIYYNNIVVNLNNCNKGLQNKVVSSIELLVEYLNEIQEETPKIIIINRKEVFIT